MNYDFTRMAAMFSAFSGALLFFTTSPSIFAQNAAQTQVTDAGAQNTDLLQSSGRFGRTSAIIGLPVVDRQNQRVGDLKDILCDLGTGQAPLAVIATDSGDKLTAVPISMCGIRARDKTIILRADRQKIEAGPSFTASSWPDFSSPAYSDQVYTYYEQPSQAPNQQNYQWTARDQDEYANDILHLYQEGKTEARMVDRELYGPASGTANLPSSITSRASFNEPSGTQAPAVSPGKLTRTSNLIGMRVQDDKGKAAGEVVDTVIDWSLGKIAYAVVTPTETENGNYRAVPPMALHQSETDSRTLVLNVDKEKLDAGPGFSRESWPAPSNQAFLHQTYQYYGQTSYWNLNNTK